MENLQCIKQGPVILKCKIRSSMDMMNRNKGSRSDGIVTDTFSLRQCQDRQDCWIINEIYDTRKLLVDPSSCLKNRCKLIQTP